MIFVDTGAFFARYYRPDEHHVQSVEAWRQLEVAGDRCVTTSLVLSEVITLLARRAGARFAAQRAQAIYASSAIEIVRPTLPCEIDAVALLAKYHDQHLSFTDCVSFVLMRQRGIQRVFGFDADFERLGFTLWPGR